nr:(2Fe-2S) ferredoxin domain-containing protein [Bacteroidota bacterium]
MAKIKSLADLRLKKEELQKRFSLGKKIQDPEKFTHIKVGMGTSGIASGATVVMDYMTDELDKRGIEAIVSQTGDMGYCYAEPTIEVKRPGGEPIVFGYVDTGRANEIIEKYIKNGELIEGIIPVNYESIDKY